MNEKKEVEEMNYSGLLTIFFIVLTIAVAAIFFVAGMLYANHIKEDTDCPTVEPAIEEQVIEEETYEIDDTSTIELLDKSTKILFSSNKNIINSKDKSLLVLNYLYSINELKYDKYKSTYSNLFKKEPSNKIKNDCYQIDKEIISHKKSCSIIPAKYFIYDYLEDKNNYYVYLAYGNLEYNKKYILYTDNNNSSIYMEDKL